VSHLAATLDLLNLMTYDFVGSWTDVSGHHAQLRSPSGGDTVYPTLRKCGITGVDHLLERGFPAGKIALGIPAYARGFVGARGPGHPFKKSVEVDYRDMREEWVRGARVDREVVAASWAGEGVAGAEDAGKKEGEKRSVGPEAMREVGFLSFDVPETVRAKAEFVVQRGLAGLFYWTGSGDREGGESLVRAGWESLTKRG
jgi:chitinase